MIFTQTFGSVQNTTQRIDTLVAAVDQEQITSMVTHLNTIISSNYLETVSNILGNLEQTTLNAGELSSSLHSLVAANEDQFNAILTLLDTTLKSGEQLVSRFNQLLTTNTGEY